MALILALTLTFGICRNLCRIPITKLHGFWAAMRPAILESNVSFTAVFSSKHGF